MSLDKFVRPGFSGSGGEGRLVTTTPQYVQKPTNNRMEGGTNFVMGGGALGQRVTPKSEASSYGKDFKEERYSFNYDKLRSKGTMRSIKEQKEGAGMSLIEALQTAKGHRISFSIILYGIALIIVIFLLSNMLGGGPSDDFYVAPNGLSVDVRPMWNRR